MKVIRNRILPLGSYVAMVIGPWIFTKRERLSKVAVNHEGIHWEQQKETAVVGFYVLYGLFFLWELLRCLLNHSRGTRADGRYRSTWKRTYRMNAFEREAYAHEGEMDYTKRRRHYAWVG